MDHDVGQGDAAEEGQGVFVVPGGDAAPLLEAVDAPLDGVALLVCLAVEGRRSAARLSALPPVGLLIGAFRNHRADATSAQVVADRAGGVRLVAQDQVRPGAGPSKRAGNAQAGHDVREGGCVTGLAGGEDERQWSAPAVGREVDLRGQSAAGPADGVIARLAGRSPFLRAPAACWCARTMVESTETAQLRSSSASACATSAVNTRSQVPSTAHIRSRL